MQISCKQFKGKLHTSNRIFSSIGVASACGGAVIIMIAVNTLYGVIALLVAGLIFIGIPAAYLALSKNKTQAKRQLVSEKLSLSPTSHGLMSSVEKIVTTATSYSPAVLIITAVITAASVVNKRINGAGTNRNSAAAPAMKTTPSITAVHAARLAPAGSMRPTA